AFTLAEPSYDEFAAIKLTQPLKRSLTAKTTAMKTALGRYEKVAAIGVSEYATAANYKIGQMYRVLAKDMLESERPKGLDDLELEQYDLLLEEQALPYEDQAIDILIANTDLVKDNIYDKWVKQSFAELGQLLPGRYAKSEQVEDYIDLIYWSSPAGRHVGGNVAGPRRLRQQTGGHRTGWQRGETRVQVRRGSRSGRRCGRKRCRAYSTGAA